MSDDWIEQSALRFEGFDDNEIAQITAAIPKAQHLLTLVQQHQSVIDQASSLAKELLPVATLIATKLKARIQ